ncbi:sigma-54 interaction domain-containing protein [Peribacillus asahii]|uniref:sigma-54 interaction domain-containing protein n=1 Tax=Peribacillus asahii TaxID=228899 RepID=UPI00380C08F4
MIGLYTTDFLQKEDKEKLVLLFGTIFETSHDGIYVFGGDGSPLLYNEAFLRISKIPRQYIGKTNIFDSIKRGPVPNTCASVAIETKRVYTTIINYYDGKKGLVTSTPLLDENEKVVFAISNIRDMNEVIQSEREIDEAQTNSSFKEALTWLQQESSKGQQLVYRSMNMHQVISLASRFAKNDSPILLLGESGVGKDVLANHIHERSNRKGKFVKINCGAIPDHLLESELFGYEKGAFTGADKSKEGLFESANEGTVFLDEIGDLPYPLQVKLLNVLQDSEIRRLGGTETRSVSIRIIAATNSDLDVLVQQKKFRLDLYYRLNVLSITIPPLRERKEDIPALLFYYLRQLEMKYKEEKRIDNDVFEACIHYNWPGNIRELKNIIERLYHLSEGRNIALEQLPPFIYDPSRKCGNKDNSHQHFEIQPLKQAVSEFEKEYIKKCLSSTSTLQECANLLKVNISTLVRKKKTLGIK